MRDNNALSEIIIRHKDNRLPASSLDLVLSVLETPLSILFQDVFIRTRYFDLGLVFYDICQGELIPHKDQFEDWQFARHQRYLVTLKLKMLDYLNLWDEYLTFTHLALETMQYPYILNVTRPVDPIYFYIDEDGEQQIHFLYQQGIRYQQINRKVARRNAGKNTDHLLRHQQDELTDAEIERRYKVVVDFFSTCYPG